MFFLFHGLKRKIKIVKKVYTGTARTIIRDQNFNFNIKILFIINGDLLLVNFLPKKDFINSTI